VRPDGPSAATGTLTADDSLTAAGSLTAGSLAAKGGQHPPTAVDEGGLDDGNGEPMDDVDDEEVPATDKSGADHPAVVDEESEGTGIKLQE
jgi:hypothetical protein